MQQINLFLFLKDLLSFTEINRCRGYGTARRRCGGGEGLECESEMKEKKIIRRIQLNIS